MAFEWMHVDSHLHQPCSSRAAQTVPLTHCPTSRQVCCGCLWCAPPAHMSGPWLHPYSQGEEKAAEKQVYLQESWDLD